MKRLLASRLLWGPLLAAFALSRLSVYYFSRPLLCEAPCRDLSSRIENLDKSSRYRPACSPLKLTLELKSLNPRAGQSHGVFYRLRLRNVGCETLEVQARSFRYSAYFHPQEGPEYRFTFDRPDGTQARPPYPNSDFVLDEVAIPYTTDISLRPGLEPTLEKDEWGLYQVELKPGEEIVTNPSKLEPHCPSDPEIERFIELYKGTAEGRAAIQRITDWEQEKCQAALKRLKAPPPPEGFRALHDLTFRTPGTYKVRAEYEDLVVARPVFKNLEALPPRLRSALVTLNRFFPILPSRSGGSRILEARAESDTLEFEVLP